LEAELYYVREGVVNTYAMNFVVPVPANIADLEFSWQSLVGHPILRNKALIRKTDEGLRLLGLGPFRDALDLAKQGFDKKS
ncbi:Tyrosine-protein kinase Drl, partial [Harpegnathos saltator]